MITTDIIDVAYAVDENLRTLGTFDELKAYLTEEVDEINKHNIDIVNMDCERNNPNNILLYYLLAKADMPKRLQHNWSEGDFPDIDADFAPEGREAIKQYLVNRYGEDHVKSVVAWGTSNFNGALKDLCDALGIQRNFINTFVRSIEDEELETTEAKIDYLMYKFPEMKQIFEENPKLVEWLPVYYNVVKNISQHAAALVVSEDSISENLPLVRKAREDGIVIGHSESGKLKELQPQGFIKYDFLGLKHVSILNSAIQYVEKYHKIKIDEKFWSEVGNADFKSFEIAKAGELDGIFQFEGGTGYKCIMEIKPNNLDDLSFANAGMRPGALEAKLPEIYYRRMHGITDEDTLDINQLARYNIDSAFIKSLSKTYGLIVYQEQIMQFLHHVGGIDLPKTNKVRKVITIAPEKRKPEHTAIIEEVYGKYIEHTLTLGMSQELAQAWWNNVVGQAGYSFNASHSYAYAIIAYRELYIKAHYPKEFYLALLENSDVDKIGEYIGSAKRMGIKIMPPDVNKSEDCHVLEGNDIRLGLSIIKRLNKLSKNKILAARPFDSYDDYLSRGPISMTAMKALIYSGAMDRFEVGRGKMLEIFSSKVKKVIPRSSYIQFIEAERDYIGYAFSASKYVERPNDVLSFEHILNIEEIQEVRIMGFVSKSIESKLKSGKHVGEYYGIYEITNYRSTISGVKMWAELYKEYGYKLIDGSWFDAVMQKNKYGWSFKRILDYAEHGIEELEERGASQ